MFSQVKQPDSNLLTLGVNHPSHFLISNASMTAFRMIREGLKYPPIFEALAA